MTDKELLKKTAERLRKISEDTQRITTGNMSHNLTCLKGFALRSAESIEKHLQEEPVSEDLGEYINELSKQFPEVSFAKLSRIAVRVAKWQKEQDQSTIELAEDHAMLAGMEKMKEEIMKNIWKPADGNDLPEYDREVIVLTQPYPLEGSEFAVSFAHRPNSKGWDGKSVITGEIEHCEANTYGKGCWSISDVKYWLDIKFPNE